MHFEYIHWKNLKYNFHFQVLFQWSIWQTVTIGSCNGIAWSKLQTITRTRNSWITHTCITNPQWVNSSCSGKMTAVSQTKTSNAFSWFNIFVFWFECHWRLFLSVQLTVSQHWFRWWLDAKQAASHYLKQCWPRSLTHLCGPKGRAVKLSTKRVWWGDCLRDLYHR